MSTWLPKPIGLRKNSSYSGSASSGAAPPPMYLNNITPNFWFKPLADSVLYVQFNQVMNSNDETLAAFAGKLGTTLREMN